MEDTFDQIVEKTVLVMDFLREGRDLERNDETVLNVVRDTIMTTIGSFIALQGTTWESFIDRYVEHCNHVPAIGILLPVWRAEDLIHNNPQNKLINNPGTDSHG